MIVDSAPPTPLPTNLPVVNGPYSTAIAQGSPGGLPVPSLAYVGQYARVTDLFGEKTDLVLCSAYGGKYFWQPVRPFWTNTSAMTVNQDMTLRPLRSPSLIRLTGTATANRVITFDKTLAWPGCQFEIALDGVLGLFNLTLAGLALGATLSMLASGRRRVVFDGTDYQNY